MRFENKSLDKLRADFRVKEVEQSCGEENRYSLTLKRGFIDGEASMHVMIGQTIRSMQQRIKYVEPCICGECQ